MCSQKMAAVSLSQPPPCGATAAGGKSTQKKHPKKKHPKSTRAIAPSWSGRACPRARSPGLKHPAAGQAHKASVLAAKHTKTSTCQLPTDSAAFQLPLPPKHPGSSSPLTSTWVLFSQRVLFLAGCFFWMLFPPPRRKSTQYRVLFQKAPQKKAPDQKSTQQRVLFLGLLAAAVGPLNSSCGCPEAAYKCTWPLPGIQ